MPPAILTDHAFAEVRRLVSEGQTPEQIASVIGCTTGTLKVRCSQRRVSLRVPPQLRKKRVRKRTGENLEPPPEDLKLDEMEKVHLQWCRLTFGSIKDGGVWAIPRSGLIFRRKGDRLVLTTRMPHTKAMPITEAELLDQQQREYANIKKHFEEVGIYVDDVSK